MLSAGDCWERHTMRDKYGRVPRTAPLATMNTVRSVASAIPLQCCCCSSHDEDDRLKGGWYCTDPSEAQNKPTLSARGAMILVTEVIQVYELVW
jgi:hypothetical protein